MRLPPLEVLLSWPTPNYVDPVTRGNALVIVNAIFLIITVIVVSLRIYVRLVMKRHFGLDDTLILFALLFTTGLTTVVLLANERFGWDRHAYDIPFNKFEPTMKITMSATLLFTAAATFTRLSLHCFYYRLVADSGRTWFTWIIHANVAYTVCLFFGMTYVSIFFCNPIKNYWTFTAPAGTCLKEGLTAFTCGILNSVADLATTITPIPLAMGLHMPRRQRFAVCVLFGLGFIVTIAGIARIWFVYDSLIRSYDQTWYAYPMWISTAVEIDLGVICASVPVLRPLLVKLPTGVSETFSRVMPFTRSTASASTAVQASRPAQKSAMLTDWTSDTLDGASPSITGKGQSYEMKHWDEEEQRIMAVSEDAEAEHEHGSQASMLDHDSDNDEPEQGVARIWQRMKTPDTTSDTKDAMMAHAKEIDGQSDSASSRHTSR